MSDSDQRIALLRSLFDRYLALPRQEGDNAFTEQLHTLQQWEVEDLRRRHAIISCDDAHYTAVLEYYLQEMHNGLNLQSSIDKGPRGLENARRLDKAYQLFANVIEFSVLSAEIQDQLVQKLDDQPITAQAYANAVAACDNMAERQRRLELLVEIGHEVAPHLGSRLIHTGFRLLKGLFWRTGLGDIHEAGNKGFRQLRNVPRLAQTIARLADTELAYLKGLDAS